MHERLFGGDIIFLNDLITHIRFALVLLWRVENIIYLYSVPYNQAFDSR